jgi:hypothetical protein
MSTHAAAAHAVVSAHAMPAHVAMARTQEAANHKPGKPGLPHPIFNPRQVNYGHAYTDYVWSCIPMPHDFSDCDRPAKTPPRG